GVCSACTGLANSVVGIAEIRRTILPLPKGEGRGEGEHSVAYPAVHGLNMPIKKKIMSKIINSISLPLIIFIVALALMPAAAASDWPSWGGPDPGRNMYSPTKGLPDRFDPGKPK